MLVPVIYFDGYPGKVEPEVLDEMIRRRVIVAFRRSDEWVRAGLCCRYRGMGGSYGGPDRRGRAKEKHGFQVSTYGKERE